LFGSIIQILLGAAAGYYTNKLAIAHLFSDIPLPGRPWRAVIKKGGNKERLAEDLSQIAEEKIFGNGKGQETYLSEELLKDSVSDALDQMMDALFDSFLDMGPDVLPVSGAVQELFQEIIAKENIISKSCLGDILKEQTFVRFCTELWDKGVYSGQPADQNDWICTLKDSNGGTIRELLGEDICAGFGNAIQKKAQNIAAALGRETERLKLEGYLYPVLRGLGIEQGVRAFLIELREKTVQDLFGNISPDFKQTCMDQFWNFCGQEEVYAALADLFSNLTRQIVASDLCIGDLLPEGCFKRKEWIKAVADGMEELEPFVSELYKKNQEIISQRLCQELSAVIDEGTGNFLQNMVLFGAKELILQKMREYLEQKMPVSLSDFMKHTPEEVCESICSGIAAIRISKLVELASFDDLWSLLKKNDSIADALLNRILTIKLSVFLTDDVVDSAAKEAQKKCLQIVSDWMAKEDGALEGMALNVFNYLLDTPVQASWLNGIFKHVDTKKESLFQALYHHIEPITVKEIAQSGIWMERLFSGLTPEIILSMLPKEKLKQNVHEIFTGHAGEYLHIRPMVKEKVLSLDEDQLCEMMQKFMGNELRPLNILGGVLGATAGFFMSLLLPDNSLSLPVILLSILCYAVVGIGTNVLALHGLFRPYHIKERRHLSRLADSQSLPARTLYALYCLTGKIPVLKNLCYLGYIPEKKEQIALGLAQFMANNFLQPKDLLPKVTFTKEMAVKFLDQNRDGISKIMTDWMINKTKEDGWLTNIFDHARPHMINGCLHADISGIVNHAVLSAGDIKNKPVSDYFNAAQAGDMCLSFLSRNAQHIPDYARNVFTNWYQVNLKDKETGVFLQHKDIPAKFYTWIDQTIYQEKWKDALSLSIEHFFIACSADSEKQILDLFESYPRRMVNGHREELLDFLLGLITNALKQYLANHEEKLVDKLNAQIEMMIDEMSESSGVGGLATSMLGIRQLISKVYHRMFVDIPVAGEGEDEIIMEQNLVDVLADENREALLEKIGQMFDQHLFSMTIGDLEPFLFYDPDNMDAAMHRYAVKLCNLVSSVISQSREWNEKPLDTIVESLYQQAERKTVGAYVSFFALDHIAGQLFDALSQAMLSACQREPLQNDFRECAEYIWKSYIEIDLMGQYLSPLFDYAGDRAAVLWYQLGESERFRKWMDGLFLPETVPALSACLNEICENCFWSEDAEDEIYHLFIDFLKDAADMLAGQGDFSTVVQTVLNVCNQMFSPEEEKGAVLVLAQIDFKTVIHNAVDDMGDAQIEQLFYGFAGQYFTSLKLSGALGAVFGIPGVQYAAVLVALVSSMVNIKKK